MAAKGYFSHQQPDGDWAWDLMTAAGIKWYRGRRDHRLEHVGHAGGLGRPLPASSGTTRPRHYALLTSASYNYFGVGLAVDESGKKLWTVVFMKGPDRTGAKAQVPDLQQRPRPTRCPTASTSTARKDVTIKWAGNDVRLQVLTAGLKYFQVQVRREGVFDWRDDEVLDHRDLDGPEPRQGPRLPVPIRAKDRAGNYGRLVSDALDQALIGRPQRPRR